MDTSGGKSMTIATRFSIAVTLLVVAGGAPAFADANAVARALGGVRPRLCIGQARCRTRPL